MNYKVERGNKHADRYRWRVRALSGLSVLFASSSWDAARLYALMRKAGVPHKRAYSVAKHGSIHNGNIYLASEGKRCGGLPIVTPRFPKQIPLRLGRVQ